MSKTVGIYGTWRATEDSPLYRLAREMGRITARHGFSVLTGAYSGIMEAGPRGAKEERGETLGYAWNKLDAELSPNPFLDRIVTFTNLEKRIAGLVGDADVCVFFPGRTGSVAELALATEMRAKGEKKVPLVLVGDFWSGFFSWLTKSNNALGLPADASEGPEPYVTIENAGDFDRFLEQYEHTWHK